VTRRRRFRKSFLTSSRRSDCARGGVFATAQGVHLSPRRGTSLEFADYRSLTRSATIRAPSTGASTRATDRLYVKVFRRGGSLRLPLRRHQRIDGAFPDADGKPRGSLARARALLRHPIQRRFRTPARLKSGHDDRDSVLLRTTADARGTRVSRARASGDKLELGASIARHLSGLRRPGRAIVISDLLLRSPTFRPA